MATNKILRPHHFAVYAGVAYLLAAPIMFMPGIARYIHTTSMRNATIERYEDVQRAAAIHQVKLVLAGLADPSSIADGWQRDAAASLRLIHLAGNDEQVKMLTSTSSAPGLLFARYQTCKRWSALWTSACDYVDDRLGISVSDLAAIWDSNAKAVADYIGPAPVVPPQPAALATSAPPFVKTVFGGRVGFGGWLAFSLLAAALYFGIGSLTCRGDKEARTEEERRWASPFVLPHFVLGLLALLPMLPGYLLFQLARLGTRDMTPALERWRDWWQKPKKLDSYETKLYELRRALTDGSITDPTVRVRVEEALQKSRRIVAHPDQVATALEEVEAVNANYDEV